MNGDRVTEMRLRDLIDRAEHEGGVGGVTALLRSLVQDEGGGAMAPAALCPRQSAPNEPQWASWLRGQGAGTEEEHESELAGRVRCLHWLARLWPSWQRGQGILELVQALHPGPRRLFDWASLQAKTDSLLADKRSFRALESTHMALLELRLASPFEGTAQPPEVPQLADLPAPQADALVRALHHCPPKHRDAFAKTLRYFRICDPQNVVLLNALPVFTVPEWDAFMQAIDALKSADSHQDLIPVLELQLPALFAVARLGCHHAELLARFWVGSRAHAYPPAVRLAQSRWLELRDSTDLEARVQAALEFAAWGPTARSELADTLLEHFFDPALKDPTQYITLLREQGAEHASPRTLMAMLTAPRHLVPCVALVGSGDADLLDRVQGALPRAQAVAPWLQVYENSDDKHLVLNIAERMPVDVLPALAQTMRCCPHDAVWLAAVHGCSAAALTRFAHRDHVSGGPRGWLQLAACALPDLPRALQPPDLKRVAGLTAQPTSLQPFKELLRYLPTDAHRAVWVEDTRLDWPSWRLEQVEDALRLAHAFPAATYAAVLFTLQRLRPWVSATPETLREILRLPEVAQPNALRALALFGTPATEQRQRLARLIFDDLIPQQWAPIAAALARLTGAGGPPPSDETIAALLLQLPPQDRGKVLMTMAEPSPWSWREQAEFLARVPMTQRAHVTELLHTFCAHPNELPATSAARAGLLGQLTPATASRVLQDAIQVMMRTASTPPDLTALVQVLDRFQDANARHRAADQVSRGMAPSEVLDLLAGQADLNNAVGVRTRDVPAQEPALGQIWADEENVMLAERRAAVGRAVETLVARYPIRRPAAMDAFLMRPLSAMARRLIMEVIRPNDEALPVTDTCSVDTVMVLGTVLNAIADWRDPAGDAATETGRENMRQALERNLERCWEPRTGRDRRLWHPVCLVGQIERMVLPLNGYDPDVQLVLVTPRELVNEMAAALQARRGDAPVPEEALQGMLRGCHALAQEMFAGDAERVAECDTLAQAALAYLRD